MCVLEKVTGIHMTTKDKVDLSVSLVTLADCVWFAGDMYYNPIHPHHYLVMTLLLLGTLFSFRLIVKLIKRHHEAHVKKMQAKKEVYIPQNRQSEK